MVGYFERDELAPLCYWPKAARLPLVNISSHTVHRLGKRLRRLNMRRYSKHRGTSTRSFMAIWLLAICSLVYGTGHLIGSPKVQSVTHPISNTFSASVRPSLARITNLPRHAWAKAFSGRASPLRKFNVAVSEYAGYHDEGQ